MIVDDDGKPIEVHVAAQRLPSAFGGLMANMEKIQRDAAIKTKALDELSRKAQALSQPSPAFDDRALIASIASIKPRPEIGLLSSLLESQTEENAAVAKMAEGIEKLADHAETEARRGERESKKTTWIIAISAVAAVFGLAIVVLTVELLSRTPVPH